MPLRVELKPFERIVIGETVIINSGTRTSFLIDGESADSAREGHRDRRDRQYAGQAALSLRSDDVSEKRHYRAIETAYLGFIKELRSAFPGARDLIDGIEQHVATGSLYKALKEIRKLMKREEDMAAV